MVSRDAGRAPSRGCGSGYRRGTGRALPASLGPSRHATTLCPHQILSHRLQVMGTGREGEPHWGDPLPLQRVRQELRGGLQPGVAPVRARHGVGSVGGSTANGLISPPTSGSTPVSNPTSAGIAGRASTSTRPSPNTAGFTPGRSPTAAPSAGRASARAPTSSRTDGSTTGCTSSVHEWLQLPHRAGEDQRWPAHPGGLLQRL